MPPTSQQWYEQVHARVRADGYRPWNSAGWSTWPVDGELTVRELHPLAAAGEPLRGGEDGESPRCEAARMGELQVHHERGGEALPGGSAR